MDYDNNVSGGLQLVQDVGSRLENIKQTRPEMPTAIRAVLDPDKQRAGILMNLEVDGFEKIRDDFPVIQRMTPAEAASKIFPFLDTLATTQ